MEIVIKLTPEDLAAAIKAGGIQAVSPSSQATPKKRGRPSKVDAAAKAEAAEDLDEDLEEDADDEDDTPPAKPAAKAKKKPAPVEVADDEDDEDSDDDAEDDDDDDDSDDEDEPQYVGGANLVKLQKALAAFAKAKGSKDAAVKVLRKYAPSSERVKLDDLPKLLKALKAA